MSVIKTNQWNLCHLGPDVHTLRTTADWSVKGPVSEKKWTGSRCRNGIDAVRGHIWASQGGGQQKKVLTQREGNQRGQGTFDFNNSDQKVLREAEVDKSAHTFSLSKSFLIIWALTGKQLSLEILALGFKKPEPQIISGGKFVKVIKARVKTNQSSQCAKIPLSRTKQQETQLDQEKFYHFHFSWRLLSTLTLILDLLSSPSFNIIHQAVWRHCCRGPVGFLSTNQICVW